MTLVIVSGLAALAQPKITGAANAVSYQQTFSPGSLAAIYGSGFAAGATVSVGTIAAYVLPNEVTAGQINVQLPVNAVVGATTITVTSGGQTSNAFPITLTAYAPAIATANGSGTGLGDFFDAKTFTQITAANPAKPGESLTTYATGLGATNPAVATGGSPAGLTPTVVQPTITVGTEGFPVSFSGLYGPGTYQINLQVPSDAGCATNLVLSIGSGANAASAPAVTLPIAPPAPVICAIENSATYAVKDATHAAAPGSFISVYVAGLNVSDSNGSLFPSTSYQGVEVDFEGAALPLYNVLASVNLINTMLPSNAPTTGTGMITVKNSSGTSATDVIALGPADVGVFPFGGPSAPNQGVVLLANSYWFAMPASLAPTYSLPIRPAAVYRPRRRAGSRCIPVTRS